MTGPEQYLFITPVWGDAYVERFVKVCLPSQLSSGNLGAMPPEKSLFLIYTRREHARTITRSPAYRQLKSMLPVAIRSLDDLPDPRLSKNPHDLQTAAYQRGIRAGEGKETAFVFLTPDILIGDGTYRNMLLRSGAGKRIHLVAGIRMLTDGALSCVVQHQAKAGAAVAIPCRDLVRAVFDNMHPISAAHVVQDRRVYAAQHLYWKVGDHGLLARGFHLHPLFVWPRNPGAVIRGTLDDEYVSRACPDRSDWHTVSDSDEMCVIEFSDRVHKDGMVGDKPLSERELAIFLHKCTTVDHREHVMDKLRFHTRGAEGQEWDSAARQSDELVKHFFDLFERGISESPVATAPGPLASPSARNLLRLLSLPFRAANRLLHYKLYRYADRLNAVVQYQQIQLEQSLKQHQIAAKIVEDLVDRVGKLEMEASLAAARAARETEQRRKLELKLRKAG